MKVYCKLIHKDAKLPAKAHHSDAGYDISAAIDEPFLIPPGGQAVIGTGVRVHIKDDAYDKRAMIMRDAEGSIIGDMPYSWLIEVRPRSGLAAKHQVTVGNSPGTVDEGYTGEIKVILINHGSKDFLVESGDRIAQLLVTRSFSPDFLETKEIGETDRGDLGFGSTGVN